MIRLSHVVILVACLALFPAIAEAQVRDDTTRPASAGTTKTIPRKPVTRPAKGAPPEPAGAKAASGTAGSAGATKNATARPDSGRTRQPGTSTKIDVTKLRPRPQGQ